MIQIAPNPPCCYGSCCLKILGVLWIWRDSGLENDKREKLWKAVFRNKDVPAGQACLNSMSPSQNIPPFPHLTLYKRFTVFCHLMEIAPLVINLRKGTHSPKALCTLESISSIIWTVEIVHGIYEEGGETCTGHQSWETESLVLVLTEWKLSLLWGDRSVLVRQIIF